jgi:hypothetical protein
MVVAVEFFGPCCRAGRRAEADSAAQPPARGRALCNEAKLTACRDADGGLLPEIV